MKECSLIFFSGMNFIDISYAGQKEMMICMKTIYKRSYRQPKSDFMLSNSAYKVTITRISSYDEYRKIIETVDSKSDVLTTNRDLNNKNIAKFYKECIENGLSWIKEDKREIIWEFVISDSSFKELAEKYHYTEEYLRECYHKYVYGVGCELGENLYS